MAEELLLKSVGLVRNKTTILKQVDFTLAPGRSLSLTGVSGQGKSSLIKLITGIMIPSNGEIRYGSLNITKPNFDARAEYRRRVIGAAYQSPHLIPSLNVYENLKLAIDIARPEFSLKKERVETALESFGAEDLAKAYSKTLSGGEQRRVALARAFIVEPQLVILDEPLTGIDVESAIQVTQKIFELRENLEASLIIATHSKDIGYRCDHNYDLDQESLIR